MTTYQLYNLDLGENPAIRTFLVGPFTITLGDDYEKIHKRLSAQAKVNHQFQSVPGGGISFSKTYIPEIVGEALITATASCEIEGNALLIKDETPPNPEEDKKPENEITSEIWDLCIILSYLTGRRVYTENEKRRFSHIHHGQGVVQPSDISIAANRAWENRKNFDDEKLIPLWLYLHINDTPEAELKMLIGTVILELIPKIEVLSQPIISDDLKDCIDKVKETIEGSNLSKVTKSKFKNTVSHWGEASLNEAFRNLLIHYDLITEGIVGIPKKRVDAISSYRNGIVHAGKLKEIDWIKDPLVQKHLAIFYLAQFNIALIQEYINRKFGITKNFWWPKQSYDNLKKYIETGYWDNTNQEA